jgi:4-hydroxybenzoate polyprenyltransferase
MIAAIFCLLLAAWWQFHEQAALAAGIAAVVGIVFVLLALGWPDALRFIQVGVMAMVYPVGWLVSHLVLIVIWYGLFTAVATVFRLIGRDALQRSFDRSAATYWQPKVMPTDATRYLRQY